MLRAEWEAFREMEQLNMPHVPLEPLGDPVNHPRHYTYGGIETIDVIEAWGLGYHLGNAIKYISRAGKKNPDPTEDINKAIWYLKRYLGTREDPR